MKTESQQQITFVQWSKRNAVQYPELNLLFAIPNGGKRHIATGSRLTLEGLKKGVSDLFLSVARRGYHGLYIEMKKSEKEKLSKYQKEWEALVTEQGYAFKRANNSEQAINIVKSYLQI